MICVKSFVYAVRGDERHETRLFWAFRELVLGYRMHIRIALVRTP